MSAVGMQTDCYNAFDGRLQKAKEHCLWWQTSILLAEEDCLWWQTIQDIGALSLMANYNRPRWTRFGFLDNIWNSCLGQPVHRSLYILSIINVIISLDFFKSKETKVKNQFIQRWLVKQIVGQTNIL